MLGNILQLSTPIKMFGFNWCPGVWELGRIKLPQECSFIVRLLHYVLCLCGGGERGSKGVDFITPSTPIMDIVLCQSSIVLLFGVVVNWSPMALRLGLFGTSFNLGVSFKIQELFIYLLYFKFI